MKSLSITGAAIALSLFDGVAAVKNTNKQSTVHCFTSFGKKQVAHLPTKSFTTTAPRTATVIVNSTPVTTVFPPDVTSTVTNTEVVDTTTTLDQNTDTITQTDSTTVDSTITMDTTTIVETSTSMTTTTTTATTTIAAPSNFVDANDSLNGGNDIEDRGISGAAVNGRHFARAQPNQQPDSLGPEENGLYPRKVICKNIVFSYTSVTSTSTAPTSTVNAPTQTDMATTVTTVTNTQTTQPDDASVTNTVTNTYTNTVVTTPSTTSTSTQVVTATVNAPQQTQYAQCSQSNIINAAQGQDINYVYGSAIYNYNYGGFATPYDCCVACALDTSCMASVFDPTYGYCAIADSTSASSCSAGRQNSGLFAALQGTSGDNLHTQFVSNGACGAIVPGTSNGRSVAA